MEKMVSGHLPVTLPGLICDVQALLIKGLLFLFQ